LLHSSNLSNRNSRKNSLNNSVSNFIFEQKSSSKTSIFETLDLESREIENRIKPKISIKTEFGLRNKNKIHNQNINDINYTNYHSDTYYNQNSFGKIDSFSNEKLNFIFKNIEREPSRPLSREQDNYFIISNNANFNVKNHIPNYFTPRIDYNHNFSGIPETAKRLFLGHSTSQIDIKKTFNNPNTTKNFNVNESKFGFGEKNRKNFFTEKSLIDVNNDSNNKRKEEILNNDNCCDLLKATNRNYNKNDDNLREKNLFSYNLDRDEKADLSKNSHKIPIIKRKKSKENNDMNIINKKDSKFKSNLDGKINNLQLTSLDKISTIMNSLKESQAAQAQTRYLISNTNYSKNFNDMQSETANEIFKNINNKNNVNYKTFENDSNLTKTSSGINTQKEEYSMNNTSQTLNKISKPKKIVLKNF
jgi:hypothetical protein